MPRRPDDIEIDVADLAATVDDAIDLEHVHDAPAPRPSVHNTAELRRFLGAGSAGILAEIESRRSLSNHERAIAHDIAELVVPTLARAIRSSPDSQRITVLEAAVAELEQYRLRLTGVAEGNGRIGKLDRTISDLRDEMLAGYAALRADVGPSDEAKPNREAAANLRSIRRRVTAGFVAAAITIGTVARAAYTANRDAHDAAIAAEARTALRLDTLETILFRALPAVPRTTP